VVERSEEEEKQLTPQFPIGEGLAGDAGELAGHGLERMIAESAQKTFAEKVNSLMMGCMCPQEEGTTGDPS
jgi:hypothetical protein